MSDSRRSSGGSSKRGSNRRAAGVRRNAGADSSAPKGTSRTGTSKAGSSKSGAKTGGEAAATTAAAKGSAKKGSAKKRTQPKNLLNYPRAGRSNPWRWVPSWRMIVGVFALIVLGGLGFSAWMYYDTEVPEASDFALAQTSRVYFSDGETEMGEFSEINRTVLPNDEIPDNVKDAVVASEDSSFYENRGISPRGIVRALWNNVQGGNRQGGSTITQQYVERYYTGTVTSIPGKVREMFMAVKADQELSKDEILSRYLNTIYFGRGAYGVQEAAQAYFDKDAADLTDEEAALLVAVIPAPSAYDPAVDPDRSEQLWDRVIDRQVNETGYLASADADAFEFPETTDSESQNVMGGTNGYLLNEVRSELSARGIDEDDLNRGGYTVVSTIDPKVQDAAVETIDELPERPENNRIGTISVDPSTGAVRGMYGGPDFVAQGQNDATNSRMQAGSTFKTFTLIAALEDGYPLSSRWDGNGPKTLGGWTVNNFNNVSYGSVDLRQATADSVNTAYAELNVEIGPERTRDAAVELGLPEDTPGLESDASNVLGTASPTVLEMGEAYATIAAGGLEREPYFVESVERPDGSMAYEHEVEDNRVLDEEVAINATVALQGPPSTGSASKLQGVMDGRPIAGKTGTSESFRSAWFVGFTPQLVTSVGMFQPGGDGEEESLTPFAGYDYISGSTVPADIWGSIMSRSLEGEEFIDFPGEVQLPNQVQPTWEPPPATQEPEGDPDPEPEPEPEPEPTEEETTEEEPTEEPTTDDPEPTEEPTEDDPPPEDPPTNEDPPEEEPTTDDPEPTEDPTEGTDGPTTEGTEDDE